MTATPLVAPTVERPARVTLRGEITSIGLVGYGTVGSTIGARARAVGLAVSVNDPRITASRSLDDVVATAQLVLICVPTPLGADGTLDTSLVAEAVSRVSGARAIVIVSTLNPGTCVALQARHAGIRIAHVPEFLRQAHAATDFMSAPRVVIGCDEPALAEELKTLYRKLVPGAALVVVSPTTAEITKLASNAFLATKVIFANEAAAACANAAVDWEVVANALGLDPRISPSHLAVTAEGGFDGACLPKDTAAFATWLRTSTGRESLAASVLDTNARLRSRNSPGG